MEKALTGWCLSNHLPTLPPKLEQLDIKSETDLSLLSSQDIDELITACSMSFGDKLRFKNAIRKLQIPKQLCGIALLLNTAHNLGQGNLGPQADFSVAQPLDIFEADLDPSTLPDIHQAVKLGLGSLWKPKIHDIMIQTAQSHIENSESVKRFMAETNCPLNVAGAVVYYSYHMKKEKHNIYKIINTLLAKRKKDDLVSWQAFLYYLCLAEQYLPPLEANTKTYRGLTIPLTQISPQYQPGNDVVWPAFTSVSTKRETTREFSKEREGTRPNSQTFSFCPRELADD